MHGCNVAQDLRLDTPDAGVMPLVQDLLNPLRDSCHHPYGKNIHTAMVRMVKEFVSREISMAGLD
jgi:hypothetical protein